MLALRKELQTRAAGYQLTSAFSFGAKTAPAAGAPGSVGFTITLSGAFTDIISFVGELERTIPLIGVDGVEVNKQGNAFSARIEGKLFTR